MTDDRHTYKGRSPLVSRMRGAMMRMPLMMTCREFEEFVDDYLDGKLSWGARFKFQMHLKTCRECRSYLDAYIRSVELGRKSFSDPDAPVPDDVPEELVEMIMEARKREADGGTE